MLGNVKTYVKEHPVWTSLIVISILYPIMELMGLPEIMIDLDAIYVIVMMVAAFYAGWLVANKYHEKVNKAFKQLYKKLHLERLFGEYEEPSAIQDMISKLETKRRKSELTSRGVKVNPMWIDNFYIYINSFLGDAEDAIKKVDSFDLAAMIVYAMRREGNDEKEFAICFDVIKDMLIQPFECTLYRVLEEEYYVVYDISDINKLPKLDERFKTDEVFRNEVLFIMSLYATDSLTMTRMEFLAENLRRNSEKVHAF